MWSSFSHCYWYQKQNNTKTGWEYTVYNFMVRLLWKEGRKGRMGEREKGWKVIDKEFRDDIKGKEKFQPVK